MMLSWLIITFFAVFVMTSAYWIHDLRDVDERGTWLKRLGIRWPLHKILPWFTLLIFALLLEDAVQSGNWRATTAVEPVLIAEDPEARKGSQTDGGLDDFFKRWQSRGGSAASIILLSGTRKEDEAPRRALADALAPGDLSTIPGNEDYMIPDSSRWLTGFSVLEVMTSREPLLASGWFSHKVWPGPEKSRYPVLTWCGFDLTVTPGQRVCFSTLAMPVYHQLNFPDCTDPVETVWALGGMLRGKIRKSDPCRPLVRMARVFIKMTAEGVRTLGYLPDAGAAAWGQPQMFSDPKSLTSRFRIGLAAGWTGAQPGAIVPWQDYASPAGHIALKLGIVDGANARGRQLWSRRQIKDKPREATEFWVAWREFTGLSAEVDMPQAHLAAAAFLGHDFPWADPAAVRTATQDAWSAARIVRGDSTEFRCRHQIQARTISAHSFKERTGRANQFKAAEGMLFPNRIYRSDRRCPNFLPKSFASGQLDP